MIRSYVRDLRDAGPSCGGKAHHLAHLIAADLPVPPGFALDHAAFQHIVGEVAATDENEPTDLDALGHVLDAAASRIATTALPPELEREVVARAQQLGSRVVVRSSATIEDGDAGSAAGIFASHAVAASEVWPAIRMVWTSALSPLAVAYARRRGHAIAIGVVVQREVSGERITVYTRAPEEASCDDVLVQRGDDLARISRTNVPPAHRETVQLALRAERAIGALDSGVDVELVQSFGDKRATWLVQARPIFHRPTRSLTAPPPIVTAPLRDGRVWTWDVAHNPDPLSPAQIGLVERVECAGLGAFALRVCAGYLYSTPRGEFVPPELPFEAADLATRAATLEAKCAAILTPPPKTLEDAIERYVAFYAVWSGELAPCIAHARRASTTPYERPSSVEATLAKAARGEIAIAEVEAQLGDLAPAWDVAVAPFGDRPGILREAIAVFARASAGRATPGRSAPCVPQASAADALAALAADLAERDDLLFARAQRFVRRALIARSHELSIDPDDVFWIPLEEVIAGGDLETDTARRRAAGSRAAADRAAQWQMPLVVGGTESNSATRDDHVLRGVGSGPRVSGRVVRFASLASAVLARSGDVVVVRAVTPALAVFLGRCTALVSETGGLLDHGAAMARELGIPCVVGCAGAWAQLRDGTVITVDGDAGEITTHNPGVAPARRRPYSSSS